MSKVEIDLDLITETMDNLKKEKARLQFDLKEVEKEIEKYELQLVALLGQMNVKEMNYKAYIFGLKEVSRTALDQKYLKEHYSDIAQACTFTKTSEKFEFKIGVN